jgi:hypothetical protein
MPNSNEENDIPVVYKKSIVFFRSLYSLVRLLPCYRLSRTTGRQPKPYIGEVIYRVSTSRVNSPDEAGLHEIHLNGDMQRGISEFTFEPLQTPLGVFNLHTAYRLHCDFVIESSDTVSSRFVDQEHHYFQKRQISGSLNNVFRSRESSNETDEHTKAENRGVLLPSSIPVQQQDVFKFKTVISPRPPSVSSQHMITHFTPPSWTASALTLNRKMIRRIDNTPPFLASSIPKNLQQLSNTLNFEDMPFAISKSPVLGLHNVSLYKL